MNRPQEMEKLFKLNLAAEETKFCMGKVWNHGEWKCFHDRLHPWG